MTQISRSSMGLAVRAARDAARLTLSDLSAKTGIPVSTLSRTETGQRAIEFVEAIKIAEAVHLVVNELRTLAETIEGEGGTEKSQTHGQIKKDLKELQRLAIESAVTARS